jgi:DNA-binding NtrC family response regulator
MSDQTQNAPRVLIIEDEYLIGEMIHDMVTELGYRVTHVAHRFGSALREISKENFDGALVNIRIDAAKHGTDIADVLIEKGIPFGFVTGFGHAFETRHEKIPLLQKPFNRDQLRELLETLIGPSGTPNSHAA